MAVPFINPEDYFSILLFQFCKNVDPIHLTVVFSVTTFYS